MTSPVDAWFRRANTWRPELEKLREVVLGCGLTEELKWGQPCYTHDGKNIVIIQSMKAFLALAFFKGALLADAEGVLESPGKNSQSGRRIRFTSVRDVVRNKAIVKAYVREAVDVEKSGRKIPQATEIAFPAELRHKLDEDAAFRAAFEALTPGRQRGYVLYFSGAKQAGTRAARIEKHAPRILAGKGFHDR